MRLELFSDVNFFIGLNGQGKTNLLEGLYMLAGFRSFRGAKNRDLVSDGAEQAGLEARVEASDVERQVQVIIKPTGKSYLVDGKAPGSLSEWVSRMAVVTFSPDDLYLVKGEPELRRRWLDRIVFLLSPPHLGNVMSYGKALKARNALLKDGMFGRDLMLLDAFDETLARLGAEVARARELWARELGKLVGDEVDKMTGGRHRADLTYDSEVGPREWTEVLAEIIRRREDDVRRKQTSWGVHHDDLVLSFSGRVARRFASQGEQRALTLALKLAETRLLKRERQVAPVLLLDDVTGELDHERHALLFSQLDESRGQVFIAGTEIPKSFSLAHPQAAVYRVENGEIR